MAYITRVPSSLPDPPCGFSVYRSSPEDPGQLVCITYHDGVQVAIVKGGEDDGLEIEVAGMQGTFERVHDLDQSPALRRPSA